MATDKLVDFDHVTDYISREAAIEALRPYKVDPFKIGFLDDTIDGFNDGIDTAISALSVMPAADVRPVVLCRDCHWWTKQEKSLQGRCELAGFYPTGGWFCANGEPSNCGADMRPEGKTKE